MNTGHSPFKKLIFDLHAAAKRKRDVTDGFTEDPDISDDDAADPPPVGTSHIAFEQVRPDRMNKYM